MNNTVYSIFLNIPFGILFFIMIGVCIEIFIVAFWMVAMRGVLVRPVLVVNNSVN